MRRPGVVSMEHSQFAESDPITDDDWRQTPAILQEESRKLRLIGCITVA